MKPEERAGKIVAGLRRYLELPGSVQRRVAFEGEDPVVMVAGVLETAFRSGAEKMRRAMLDAYGGGAYGSGLGPDQIRAVTVPEADV